MSGSEPAEYFVGLLGYCQAVKINDFPARFATASEWRLLLTSFEIVISNALHEPRVVQHLDEGIEKEGKGGASGYLQILNAL